MSAPMACVGDARLAAAATGADADALAHADACVTCALVLDEQRAMRAVAARMPAPVLSAARRAAMAAELAAVGDELPVPRITPSAPRVWTIGPRGAFFAGVCAAAAAAAIAWLAATRPAAPTPALAVVPVPVASAPVVASAPAVEVSPSDPWRGSPAPSLVPAAQALAVQTSDLVRELAARVRVISAPRVVIAPAASTARVARTDGDEWTAPPVLPAVPPPAAPAADPRIPSAAAFRAGWSALRDGRLAEARAAFDRATDPSVAEDATFWAAIAAARAHDTTDAERRFRAFLARFPSSPRAAAARDALARVTR